jgi:hypothetical protein
MDTSNRVSDGAGMEMPREAESLADQTKLGAQGMIDVVSVSVMVDTTGAFVPVEGHVGGRIPMCGSCLQGLE